MSVFSAEHHARCRLSNLFRNMSGCAYRTDDCAVRIAQDCGLSLPQANELIDSLLDRGVIRSTVEFVPRGPFRAGHNVAVLVPYPGLTHADFAGEIPA